MATTDNRLPTEGTQLDIVAGLATIANALTPSNTEGHVIENDSGTELAQQDNLQFKGTYTANQTGKTVVNVTRSMTLAEYNLLSADEKKGIIEITDENGYEIKPTDIDTLYAETVYPVEESPSTHAYAQGDHLIWKGYTYIAKTAIAIGDSLVLNTNVELETLATRMNHIEDGIESASTATGTEYSSGVSVKDKLDEKVAFYKKGDAFYCNWIILPLPTNAGGTVGDLFVILPKPIASDVTTVTITGTINHIRCNGVQKSGTFANDANAQNKENGVIHVSVNLSEAVQGSSMACISINGFGISFS